MKSGGVKHIQSPQSAEKSQSAAKGEDAASPSDSSGREGGDGTDTNREREAKEVSNADL